jgi:predicted nucleotidyltransferase
MGKKKNEMRIIKNNSKKEDYTFVSDNITNNTKKNESINNEIKSGTKPKDRIEKKIHSKKVDNKGRKILGKSM